MERLAQKALPALPTPQEVFELCSPLALERTILEPPDKIIDLFPLSKSFCTIVTHFPTYKVTTTIFGPSAGTYQLSEIIDIPDVYEGEEFRLALPRQIFEQQMELTLFMNKIQGANYSVLRGELGHLTDLQASIARAA